MGELWGEGKIDKPLVPSSQKYSRSGVGSTLGVSTSSADVQTDSSSGSTGNSSSLSVAVSSSQKVSAPSTITRSTSYSTSTSTKAAKVPPPYSSIEDLITKTGPGTGKPILYLSTYNRIKDMIFVQ